MRYRHAHTTGEMRSKSKENRRDRYSHTTSEMGCRHIHTTGEMR